MAGPLALVDAPAGAQPGGGDGWPGWRGKRPGNLQLQLALVDAPAGADAGQGWLVCYGRFHRWPWK